MSSTGSGPLSRDRKCSHLYFTAADTASAAGVTQLVSGRPRTAVCPVPHPTPPFSLTWQTWQPLLSLYSKSKVAIERTSPVICKFLESQGLENKARVRISLVQHRSFLNLILLLPVLVTHAGPASRRWDLCSCRQNGLFILNWAHST